MDLKVRYEIEFHKLVLNCYISINTIWLVRVVCDNEFSWWIFYVYMEWFRGKQDLPQRNQAKK
jgi:hypothetical protein